MPSPSPRILYVEDDEGTRMLVSDILRRDGYRVLEAATAEEGLGLLSGGGVDLVLLDVGLPGMSGLEVCGRIKKAASRPPVIMVTAFGHHAAKVRGLDTGADDYIVKPVQPKVLLARVGALLRRYGTPAP